MLAAEGAESVDDERGARARERGKAEAAAVELPDRLDLDLGDGEPLERGRGAERERLAGIGEPQGPDPAVDEGGPDRRSRAATIFETAGWV